MNNKCILNQEISYKGTVRAISSDPPYRDGNTQFTNLCLIKKELDIHVFVQTVYFQLWFFCKKVMCISIVKETMEKFTKIKAQLRFQGYRCKWAIAIFA